MSLQEPSIYPVTAGILRGSNRGVCSFLCEDHWKVIIQQREGRGTELQTGRLPRAEISELPPKAKWSTKQGLWKPYHICYN